jgi:hypothetical protein
MQRGFIPGGKGKDGGFGTVLPAGFLCRCCHCCLERGGAGLVVGQLGKWEGSSENEGEHCAICWRDLGLCFVLLSAAGAGVAAAPQLQVEVVQPPTNNPTDVVECVIRPFPGIREPGRRILLPTMTGGDPGKKIQISHNHK